MTSAPIISRLRFQRSAATPAGSGEHGRRQQPGEHHDAGLRRRSGRSRAPAAGRRSSSPRNPRRRAAGPSAAVGSPGCARGGRCSRQRPSSQSDQPAPKSSRPGRGCQAGRRGSRPPPRRGPRDGRGRRALRGDTGRAQQGLPGARGARGGGGAAQLLTPHRGLHGRRRGYPATPGEQRRPRRARLLPDHRQHLVRRPVRARGDRASSTTPSTSSRSSARVRPASARSTRGGTCPRSATARPRCTRPARACCTWPSGFRRLRSSRRPATRRAAPTCAGWCGSPTRSGRSGSGSWRRSSSPATSGRTGVRAKGLEELAEIGATLEAELRGRDLVPRRALHRRGHLPLHARRLAGLQAGPA